MTPFKYTKIIKAVILLMIMSDLIPLSLSAQKQTDNNVWKNDYQLSIGVGYNLRKIPGYLEYMKPFEISANYTVNNTHSLYITLPLFIKNRNSIKKEDNPYSSQEFQNLKRHLYGITVGYDYHFIQRQSFSEFIGIGFDYYRTKERIESSNYDSSHNTKENVSHDFNQNIYALAPQFGIDYNFKLFKIELKYKYAFARIRQNEKYNFTNGEKSWNIATQHTNKVIKGLSLNIYYTF